MISRWVTHSSSPAATDPVKTGWNMNKRGVWRYYTHIIPRTWVFGHIEGITRDRRYKGTWKTGASLNLKA